MATITYRALSTAGDPLAGNGQGNFVSDINAVAQAIRTRLLLLQGEWWENLNAGTPVFQSMLGVSGSGRNPQAVVMLLKQRILGTPYVLSVSNVQTNYVPATRAFSFSCQVQTQFGTLTVATAPPGASAAITSS